MGEKSMREELAEDLFDSARNDRDFLWGLVKSYVADMSDEAVSAAWHDAGLGEER